VAALGRAQVDQHALAHDRPQRAGVGRQRQLADAVGVGHQLLDLEALARGVEPQEEAGLQVERLLDELEGVEEGLGGWSPRRPDRAWSPRPRGERAGRLSAPSAVEISRKSRASSRMERISASTRAPLSRRIRQIFAMHECDVERREERQEAGVCASASCRAQAGAPRRSHDGGLDPQGHQRQRHADPAPVERDQGRPPGHRPAGYSGEPSPPVSSTVAPGWRPPAPGRSRAR